MARRYRNLFATDHQIMIEKEENGLKWLEFELLDGSPVIHGTFKRHGGYSGMELSSLNFGNRVGDSPENVKKNLAKVSSALSIKDLITAKIEHGADIFAVKSSNKNQIPIADGLSTSQPGVGLLVSQADCQAAIFYDPVRHAMANVHCGWRGNVKNIYSCTVDHMVQKYQSNPADLLVCISPSLGPENSEFINYKLELPPEFWSFQIKPNYFDFWAISEWQLIRAGILPHHIQIAKIDTCAQHQDYFSYRHSKQCGRHATIAALK